jgi:DNA-binding protein YbaB
MSFDFDALKHLKPEDMIPRLEAMQAQAAQQLAAFEAMKEQITAITVTRTDPEGMVTVTLGSDGYITDLVLDPSLHGQQYRRLGSVIVATLAEARAELQEKLNAAAPRRG